LKKVIETRDIPSDDEIRELEEAVGFDCKIPSLLFQIAGYDGSLIDISTLEGSDEIPEHYRCKTDVPLIDTDDMKDNQDYCEEWELPDKILMIGGDGHTNFALDFRDGKVTDNDDAPVVFIETDTMKEVKVADSFGQFLCMLQPFGEEENES